jgi:hypothetical protein
MYGLQLITPPAVEPVSLATAKLYAVVDTGFTTDDPLISSFITAARQEAEKYMRRAIFNQTWTLSLDTFPMFWGRSSIKNITDTWSPYQWYFDGMVIRLPMPKLVSVTSITYVDNNMVTQTLNPDTYYADYNSEPNRIVPVSGAFWPTINANILPGGVQITFVTGTFGDGVDVNTCPQTICTGIALLSAYLYANREGAAPIPDAFYRLLSAHKFETFGYQYY